MVSHIGEIIASSNVIRPLPKGGMVFHFDDHLIGTGGGRLCYPKDGYVATLCPGEGIFGGAVAVEEGTKNLFNESLNDPDVEVVYDDLFGREVKSYKLDSHGNSGYEDFQRERRYDVSPGGQYIISFYAKWSRMLSMDIRCYDSGGNRLDNADLEWIKNPPPDPSKYQLYIMKITIPQDAVRSDIFRWYYPPTIDDIAYLTHVQFEKKSFPTSFTDSERPSGGLVYSTTDIGFDPNGDWTIYGHARRHVGSDNSGWQTLIHVGNYNESNESEFEVWLNHNGYFKLWSHDNKKSRERTLFKPNEGELEEWFSWAFVKDADVQRTYVWTRDRLIRDIWTLTHSNPIHSIIGFGTRPSSPSSYPLNGLLDEVVILPYAASEEEITSWHYSRAPFFDYTTRLGVAY